MWHGQDQDLALLAICGLTAALLGVASLWPASGEERLVPVRSPVLKGLGPSVWIARQNADSNTFVASFVESTLATAIFGVGSLVLGILSLLVAILIYARQSRQSVLQADETKKILDLHEDMLREISRMLAEQDLEHLGGEDEDEDGVEKEDEKEDEGAEGCGPGAQPGEDADVRPRDEAKFVEALERNGARLDMSKLVWEKKRRNPDVRGNLGWFVHDSTQGRAGERWFVHSGQTVTARRALPLDRLAAWTKETQRPATDIRLDYRVKFQGNSSWFVDTYSGETWKISKGGQGKKAITVAEVHGEP